MLEIFALIAFAALAMLRLLVTRAFAFGLRLVSFPA
jgi:hypothetical protein